MDIKDLTPGQKVHYTPPFYHSSQFDNGIVKEVPNLKNPFISKDCVKVVFHCNNNWDKYKNYTAELVHTIDLNPGWREVK